MASAARLGNKVDAGLLVGCVVLSLLAVVLKEQDREPIAGALRRSVVAPLVTLQRGAERWRSAWATSEAKQAAADSVAMRAVKAQALIVENDQLRRIIGLGSRLEWGFVPAEALHSTAPSEDIVTTLTLTSGSTAGIKQYSPVVAPEGLVGTIYKADPTMSIAILYTNPDFRASAMTADASTFGIIYPHTAPIGGTNAYMLELRGVPTRVRLAPNTTIYTSGLGGTFPRGIAIGTIVEELKTSEVWTRTYLVRPAVAPSRVTSVLVLTPQRVTQGTGSIWGATVNADSANKKIVAAADSLARQTALIEAKARQATLDSLKRATIDSIRRVYNLPPTPMTAADSATARRATTPAAPGATPAQGTSPQSAPVVRDTTRARRPVATPRRDSIRPDTTA
ncbi:MAG TPA: rod shape-determining protein MreC [Gemmatimonadaceae bacterium]